MSPGPLSGTDVVPAAKEEIAGSLAEFNDFRQFTVKYTHADFLGGNRIALGWIVRGDSAQRTWTHNGGTAGFSTIALFNPIVYLVNGLRWTFYGQADVSIGVSLGLTLAFLATCIAIAEWACQEHPIERRRIPAEDESGIGWHVMFGAPGPWTPVADALPRLVGFAEDESLIDFDSRSHPAYRLLTEYFAFPEKFNFVDIDLAAARVPAEVLGDAVS